MDFEKIIKEIRNNYQNSPKKNFALSHPTWINNTELKSIYHEKKSLARNGKIVYGHLIQANSKIFRRVIFGGSLPGVMLFSMDPYYDKHPEEINNIANEIYKYKNHKYAPIEIRKFVELISNEYTYVQNAELPMSLTPNGKVYYTTFMIWRKHLIKKHLTVSIFPIIADPDNVKSSMIVPKEYWTKEYGIYYKNI